MRRIEGLKVEQEIIGREETIGVDVTKRAATVAGLTVESNAQLETLNARWQEEKGLIDRLLANCVRSCARPVNRSMSPTQPFAPSLEPHHPFGLSLSKPGLALRQAQCERIRRLRPAQPERNCSRNCTRCSGKIHAVQGESPLILPSVDEQAVASVVADWTGIPVGRMVKNEVQAVLEPGRHAEQARHRPEARPGDDRAAHPDLARAAGQPAKTHRRVHALRHLRRRQDRDRAGAGRGALRRRAEHHHHQHERVPGGAHRLHAQGRAARLHRLRRGRHPDRGRAPPPVFGGAARRGREGAPRCARDLLSGVRQGLDGRRRGPDDRLQEHDHPAHHQRRQRAGDEHVPRPRVACPSRTRWPMR